VDVVIAAARIGGGALTSSWYSSRVNIGEVVGREKRVTYFGE
jgi:hypothetical protein